jgi:hypothetical protein
MPIAVFACPAYIRESLGRNEGAAIACSLCAKLRYYGSKMQGEVRSAHEMVPAELRNMGFALMRGPLLHYDWWALATAAAAGVLPETPPRRVAPHKIVAARDLRRFPLGQAA